MPFNSISFVFYFLLFTALYYFFENTKLKTLILIAGSYAFYAYSNIFNLAFLLSTSIITFFIVNRLKQRGQNNYLFFIGVILILVQLVFTKYSSILFNEISTVSSSEYSYFNIFILPIGISFYSLQAISLLADVHRGKYNGDTSLKSIMQFLSFFPQSVSGPIHRANELIPQFSIYKCFIIENLIIGFKTMLWGYFCKLIIADKISLIITPIFSLYQKQDGFSILIATILYSFQIYFDFWGYSLIAIGVGRILGFTININFLNPYSAKSFKDFWHKWHITLSKWMRDYIYISIGGNKQHYLLFCFSIIITFLVSGFWHGATFNFILWGVAHAFLYLVENLFSRKFPFANLTGFSKLLFKPIQRIIFFVLISLTWLIFKTNNIPELIILFKSIFSFSGWTIQNTLTHYLSATNLAYLIIILTAILLSHTNMISRFTDTIPVTGKERITETIFVSIFLVAIILLGDIGSQEFLYFRF